MSSKLQEVSAYLRRIITEPIGELSRAQRMLRFMLDLARHGWRQLMAHNASQLAAALTYRTIFSLVPVAVLSALVFKSLYTQTEAQQWLRSATYQQLGFSALRLEPIEKDKPDAATQPKGPSDTSVVLAVDQRIDDMIERVWQLDMKSLGIAGVLLFIWAALALFVTVEESFNAVFDCPSGRRWSARITTYWAFLTLGPVLLFASFWGVGLLVDWAAGVPLLGPVLSVFTSFAGLAASWLLLLFLYMTMPNTAVSLRPAIIGSFVAAVMWEVAKWAFAWYVKAALPYSAIYGSLALIPIFLFWLYLTWLIVLFGLELASTLQSLHGHNLKEQEATLYRNRLLCDPQWFIPIVSSIGEAFIDGRTASESELCEAMGLPRTTVLAMCDRLDRAGYVHKVLGRAREEPRFSLAKPPEKIEIPALLDLGQSITTVEQAGSTEHSGWSFLARLFRAQREAAKDFTLATVIKAS